MRLPLSVRTTAPSAARAGERAGAAGRAPRPSRWRARGAQAEGDDLDAAAGNARASRTQLGLVRDDDHPARRVGDDLLTQMRAAAALDQAQPTDRLVRAVHRQVELAGFRPAWSAARRGLACTRVASEVGTPTTRRPSRTRSASRSTKCLAVEPVPRPRRMPGWTRATAPGGGLPLQGVEAHSDLSGRPERSRCAVQRRARCAAMMRVRFADEPDRRPESRPSAWPRPRDGVL